VIIPDEKTAISVKK